MRHPLTSLAALIAALVTSPVPAQQTTPIPAPATTAPNPPAGPPLVLDRVHDNVGIAQQTAQAGKLQGRILWMDAGANVGNLNSIAKIQDIVGKVKAAGFNMIVLDVKPIVGDTVYPSRFAPKLTAWKEQTVAADLDVLRQMLLAAHTAGLPVYANLSTFGEGHKYVHRGLAYTHPDWQTILYEVDRSVSSYGGPAVPIAALDALPKNGDALTALTNAALLRTNRPGATVAVLNFDARVMAVHDGSNIKAAAIAIPPRGAALIGSGRAGQWLRANARPGAILTYAATPRYVRVRDAPEQAITMFCDPLNPDVRQHELDIVREIVTNYDVDGVVFDDRLRYAGLNADFGPRERVAFEQVVGKRLAWPDDVFRTSPYPNQDILPGPYFQPWLTWRAGVIQSWLADAAALIHEVRPQAQIAVYVGSWYGDYYKVASNWAAPDVAAPFPFLTPDYKKTGYAPLLDWLTTGCYYETPTLADSADTGVSPGATVEAAGQLSNLMVGDAAWTYAGLYALTYQGRPDQFARAIQAAAAATQGVMVFDMSQIIQFNWWDVIARAWEPGATPPAPNTIPDLLSEVRRRHAQDRQNGVPPPSFPPYLGVENTGF
ncbi:MAG: family 10 glycosylhydrolase [Armatimonadetes bacterium]|nr:family 10 glycosylhydrolase [Armatimonadota bacterium]